MNKCYFPKEHVWILFDRVHFILKITCNNCILNISKYFLLIFYNSFNMFHIKIIHIYYVLISCGYGSVGGIDCINVFSSKSGGSLPNI